jgi:electron transport complex protein RnfG
MIDIVKMIIVLTLISCAAALLIAFANLKTAERIAGQQAAAQEAALKRIIPSGAVITEYKLALSSVNDSLRFWVASVAADTFYAFQVGSKGYSSTINYLVCVDTAGIISGMTVLDQNETPGLGTRVQEVLLKRYFWNGFIGPRERTVPWFTEQFKGVSVNQSISIEKKIGEWHSLNDNARTALKNKNGITGITGSTISTRAITNGLNNKAKSYLKAIRG